jgi:hypothetical protein
MITTIEMRAAAGPARAICNGSIMTMFRHLLLLSLALIVSDLQAADVTPLKPGARFDYSKFAFQPESWKQRGLSLQLTPWTGTNVVFLTTDDTLDQSLVEWSGGATGLDQWLPSYQPFRASWQTALGSCRSFLRPLYSFRTAGFPQYGWKPALSSCALPKPFGASFDAGAAVHPFLAISYPGVWNGGCTHRPFAQHGLSCPRLQSLLRPDPPV